MALQPTLWIYLGSFALEQVLDLIVTQAEELSW
jgi:hypothetical protein